MSSSDRGPEREWWRSAAFYQIYVRSFQDSDGDGVGDLPGIRSRLPYLRELGVDALWLTPFYPSPQADHGYDVANYVDVEPLFGTLDDFDALLADAHALGIKVTIDIVPNHTSDQHEWFRNAIADPGHPDRARYMFRPGRDGGPPNGWTSAFGGPAWTLDERSGEYYLHFFAPEQPDLDWHHLPVQESFEAILRFWLDRGVDGFRIDVAHLLFKAQGLPEMDEPVPRTPFGDWLSVALLQPELHPLYRRWRRLADDYPGDRMYVGEIVIEDQERIATFVEPDQLHLSFNFGLLYEEWDAERMRDTIDRTLTALGAVGASATWVFENHDVTRVATRYGGGELGRRRARAAALLLFALPGPSFTYQGQELGLEEVDVPDEARQDPIFERTGGARPGRDGCRVPIPWSREPPAFGFSEGEPWLPMPPDWSTASVEVQEADPASMLSLFRAALGLRPRGGAFAWRESPPGTIAFDRGDLACIVNLAAPELELPQGELVLASDPGVTTILPQDTAAWVRIRARGLMARTLVFIPAWNEEANLPAVLAELRRELPDADVLVVDDGSTDRTAEVAREHGAEVLSFGENRGLQAGIAAGYGWALERGYDFCGRVDADGQHPVAELRRLLGLVESGRTDVAVGSRFVSGPGYAAYRYEPEGIRKLGTGLLRRSMRLALGRAFNDATSGLYAASAKALPALAQPYTSGAPEVEAVLRLHENGLRVEEVPVDMRERASGESKLRGKKAFLLVVTVIGTLLGAKRFWRIRRRGD